MPGVCGPRPKSPTRSSDLDRAFVVVSGQVEARLESILDVIDNPTIDNAEFGLHDDVVVRPVVVKPAAGSDHRVRHFELPLQEPTTRR